MTPPPLPHLTGKDSESPLTLARRERRGRLAYRIGAIFTGITAVGFLLLFIDTHAPTALGLRASSGFSPLGYVLMLPLVGLVGGGFAVVFATLFCKTARGQQSVWWFYASIIVLFLWSFADKIWPPPP